MRTWRHRHRIPDRMEPGAEISTISSAATRGLTRMALCAMTQPTNPEQP
ncbi:MAG: hypothetical protein RLZ98_2456 [Pseudomonadota bacterium]|jgi:hypothetical protein